MPRMKDKNKIKNIMKVLKRRGDEGVWIRELARRTEIPVATVYYYLNNFMKKDVEIKPARIGGIVHKQMKIVKLRRRKYDN